MVVAVDAVERIECTALSISTVTAAHSELQSSNSVLNPSGVLVSDQFLQITEKHRALLLTRIHREIRKQPFICRNVAITVLILKNTSAPQHK